MGKLRLELESGAFFDDPSSDQLVESLMSMQGDDSAFAILSRSDLEYMQAAPQSIAGYVIEYQEGTLDRHFQVIDTDWELLKDAFLSYSDDNGNWKNMFEWERIDLSPLEEKPSLLQKLFKYFR
jgi:hypothetical protein